MQSFNRNGSKRRGRLDVVADILYVAIDPVLGTRIMYRANLSFKQKKHYIEFCKKNELLEEVNNGGDNTLFKTTKRGKEFLRNYREATQLLGYECQ